MPKKTGKQHRNKRRAPYPPAPEIAISLVETATSGSDDVFVPVMGPPKVETFSSKVINGKASFPDKPPHQMAVAPPPPMKRLCPSELHISTSPCFAAGIGSGIGNGVFNTGFNSTFTTTTTTSEFNDKNLSPNVNIQQGAEMGWISYLWSFFSSS